MHCGEHCDIDESCHVNEYSYRILYSSVIMADLLHILYSVMLYWILNSSERSSLRKTHQNFLENNVKVVHVRFYDNNFAVGIVLIVLVYMLCLKKLYLEKCSYQKLLSTFKDKVQKYRQGCSYKPVKNCKKLNIAS